MKVNVKIQNMEACDKKLYGYITDIENLISRMKHLHSVIDKKSYGESTNKIKNAIESYQHKMQQEKKIVAKMARVLESATVIYQNTENEAYKEISGKNYKKLTRENNKVDADKAKGSHKNKYHDSRLNDGLYDQKKSGSNKNNGSGSNKNSNPGKSSGSVTMDKAMKWAINTANNDKYEYRYGGGHGSGSSKYYDCSSFVSKALQTAGVNVGTMTTSTMRNTLTQKGFKWIPWSQIGGTSKLKAGDILLKEGSHTEMYIGNKQVVGAHCSPEYIKSGNKGVTGASSISVKSYWNDGWHGVLRYVGK